MIYIICRTRSGIVLVVTPAVCGGVGMFNLTDCVGLPWPLTVWVWVFPALAMWVWVFPDSGCMGVGRPSPWLYGCGSSLTLAVWLWVFPEWPWLCGHGSLLTLTVLVWVVPDHGYVGVGLPWPWLCGRGSLLTLAVLVWVFPDHGVWVFPDHGYVGWVFPDPGWRLLFLWLSTLDANSVVDS